MGSPKPPQKITQEPFEADGAHLRRLSSLDPGATASSEDLYEYVQDILYTPIEPELLRYVLPFCLDEWRKELRGEGHGYGGMIEYLYPLLAKPEIFETHLLPNQTAAVSEFMRSAILEEIDDQRGLCYRGARVRPYRWVGALTSYGVLRPDIGTLWNEWWNLGTVGRAIAFVQYISCLMYSEYENPIFAPWTANEGGGPLSVSEFEGHLYKYRWLQPNLDFLATAVEEVKLADQLRRAVRVLEGQPEYPIASEIAEDWPLCVDFLRGQCAVLLKELATQQ